VLESDLHVLDIAALSLIVHEAGGVFTDLEGQALGLETRSALAAPPVLHGQALALIKA
jgi:histidinol-phosphatase